VVLVEVFCEIDFPVDLVGISSNYSTLI